MATIWCREVGELVKPAVGQGYREPGAGPLDCIVPERVEVVGTVACGRVELPVVIAVPGTCLPRSAHRLAPQLHGEEVVLVSSEMLEQAAEGQRRGTDARLQPDRV